MLFLFFRKVWASFSNLLISKFWLAKDLTTAIPDKLYSFYILKAFTVQFYRPNNKNGNIISGFRAILQLIDDMNNMEPTKLIVDITISSGKWWAN